jgi:cell wall-associated NlpC family hydrolase
MTQKRRPAAVMLNGFVKACTIISLLALGGCSTFSLDSSSESAWRYDVAQGSVIEAPQGMTADQAIAEVTSRSVLLLGAPYRMGGSSPDTGFDCSGLISHVFKETFNMRMPRTSEEQSLLGSRISKHDLEPGDLVFFNTRGRRNSHVGLYLGDRQFVHAPTSRGVVRIESMDHEYWSRRFDQARRLIARN